MFTWCAAIRFTQIDRYVVWRLWLDKPTANGGLQISRLYASLILLAVIALGVMLLPQRAAVRSHNA